LKTGGKSSNTLLTGVISAAKFEVYYLRDHSEIDVIAGGYKIELKGSDPTKPIQRMLMVMSLTHCVSF
jgi:hypothetical protein